MVPSTFNPLSLWNSLTAFLVFGPNLPSIPSLLGPNSPKSYPKLTNISWNSLTPLPLAPLVINSLLS